MHRIATMAAGLTLSLGSLAVASTASAQPPASAEPCAKEAAKVLKAETALARLTAVFERQQAKVKDAKEEVAEAEPTEEAEAQEELKAAKSQRSTTKKAKKAQVQRLVKAQERLATCEADSAGA